MKRVLLLLTLFIFLLPTISSATVTTVTNFIGKGVCNTKVFTAAATSADTLYLIGGTYGGSTIAYSLQVTLSGSTAVTMRMVGGQTRYKLGNLDTTGADIVITADGIYTFVCPMVGELGYFSFLFVSESGGTSATIALTAKVD